MADLFNKKKMHCHIAGNRLYSQWDTRWGFQHFFMWCSSVLVQIFEETDPLVQELLMCFALL